MSVADPSTVPAAAAPLAPRSQGVARTSRRRLIADRAARWVVSVGGLAIIASVLGILFFIVAEIAPLLRPPAVRPGPSVALAAPAAALALDEHRELAASVDPQGLVRVFALADGRELTENRLAPQPLSPDAPVSLTGFDSPTGDAAFAAGTSDGRIAAVRLLWHVDYGPNDERRVAASFAPPVLLEADPARRALGAISARLSESRTSAAAQLADGTLVALAHETVTNDFTGEVESSDSRVELPAAPRQALLRLDHEARNLYGATASGDLFWWQLAGESTAPQTASAGASPVTALALLVGDRSLVVGQANGAISVWFPVRQADESFVLTRIRDFPPRPAAVTAIAPSERNRTFAVADAAGGLALYFSSSERTLWEGKAPVAAVTALRFAPKGDGLLVAGPAKIELLAVSNPHPEISWRALFGRIWYEGYERPEFAWQSTGGTDDFESKLSLTPLVVGTLKGTFYSLLLAIPLAVLGAMFASQFLHPRLLAVVKPTVEIMAALPSVVLGFLAGLWLAPLLERTFTGLLAALLLLPLLVWLTGVGWSRLPLSFRNRWPAGAEVALYALAVVAAIGASVALAPVLERALFGGNFQSWLLAATGMRYDQRNAVVVGLAMGVAVIPVIFAIAEDAFSNVPRNLVAGSLALGANRWQTVTRVVLPTASPGIFSAIMIGFGRAVGETMIVLMSTGNTPILDLGAFDGFRTLSANIAVEIPEAPFGGSLYRTLFVAALLLFAFTFSVNTLAELVRQRLRRKYSQL